MTLLVSLHTQMNFHGVFHWIRIERVLIPKVIPTDYELELFTHEVSDLWWYR